MNQDESFTPDFQDDFDRYESGVPQEEECTSSEGHCQACVKDMGACCFCGARAETP